MGVLVKLAAAAADIAIKKAVDRIADELTTGRSCIIEFANHTDHPLHLTHHTHTSGGFATPPDDQLPAQTVEVFGSQKKSMSAAGTEGSVTYRIGDTGATVTIGWKNPYPVGTTACHSSIGGSNAAAFRVGCIRGVRDKAHMKYALRPRTLAWSDPARFGQGNPQAVSLIQSNYGEIGNLELVAVDGDALVAYWRQDHDPFTWHGPFELARGVTGTPALIQTRHGTNGNFDLVVPDANGGLLHLWRNNDD